MSTASAQTDTCPFARRNKDHHDAFCEFLADEEVKVCNRIAELVAQIEHTERLERARIDVLPHRRTETDIALAELEALQSKKDRLVSAICLANEFMNV